MSQVISFFFFFCLHVALRLISCVPELLEAPLSASILGRAQQKGLLSVGLHRLHDYSTNKHGRVDDYPYGGGGGMVLQVEPIARCIASLKEKAPKAKVLLMSPDGACFDQRMAMAFSEQQHMILLCGHYQGVDERVRELGIIDQEVSIGEYVLTGGELAALVICDAVVRLLPGVLGDGQSALGDAFQDALLSPPLYTRPACYAGLSVPAVLRSGNKAAILDWREAKASARTRERRPQLLENNKQRL